MTSALPNQHGRVLLGMRDKHHHRRPEEGDDGRQSRRVFFFFFFVCRAWNATRVREDVRMRAQSLRFPNSCLDSCKNMDTRSPMTRRRRICGSSTRARWKIKPKRDRHSHSRKRKTNDTPVVVCGCVPQGDQKAKELEHVSLLGVSQIDRIVEAVERTLKKMRAVVMLEKSVTRETGLAKVRRNKRVEIIPLVQDV